MWLLEALTVLMLEVVFSHTLAQVSTFQRLYKDQDVTFELQPTSTAWVNWAGCIIWCREDYDCEGIAWDSETHLCQLYSSLNVTSFQASPSPTLQVHLKMPSPDVWQTSGEDTYLIVQPFSGTWLDAKAHCDGLGAILGFYADKDKLVALKNEIGVNGIFVGLKQDDNNANNPWSDLRGNVYDETSIFWSSNEPNGIDEYCTMFAGKSLSDIRCDEVREIPFFCEI